MGMKVVVLVNGVFVLNWFRWLKVVDCVIWYLLCDIGMDVVSVEVCGLCLYWLLEVVVKLVIMNLCIELVLVGIKIVFGEMVDEESDD